MNDAKGSYALVIRVANRIEAQIGRLGRFHFNSGIYLYLGSARGPGGVPARLAHHLRIAKNPRWHLDWLRLDAEVLGWWQVSGMQGWECIWAQGLIDRMGAQIPVPGFGSADCRLGCPAHLLFFGTISQFRSWRQCVEEVLAGLSGPVSDGWLDHYRGSDHQGTGAD